MAAPSPRNHWNCTKENLKDLGVSQVGFLYVPCCRDLCAERAGSLLAVEQSHLLKNVSSLVKGLWEQGSQRAGPQGVSWQCPEQWS